MKPASRAQGPARRRGAGFALVEVLVAMFVVAVGILALVGLLQAATRHAKAAGLRAGAALLAADIADRLRADAAGARLGPDGYDLTGRGFPGQPAPTHAACTRDTPCSAAGLAKADVADWSARVRATLPAGSAWIQFRAGVPPTPDAVDVWVGWADPLTLSPGIADRSGIDCPATWQASEPSVRCVYLQVAL